jgi:hypothetical protein
LLATVLGIEPGSAGFKTVRIEPHLGKLQHAEGSVPHPKGDIRVELVRDKAGMKARVTLPAGVTGTFVWQGKSTMLQPGEQTLVFP